MVSRPRVGNRAGNSHWLQTRYDQSVDYLSGGADDTVRSGVLSRRSCRPHAAGRPVSRAVVRGQGRTRRHETADIGKRTLAMAQRLGPQGTKVMAPHCAPLFPTDGLRDYLTALLTHYGHMFILMSNQLTTPSRGVYSD